MMTGIWLRDAGGSDLHVLNSETELGLGGYCRDNNQANAEKNSIHNQLRHHGNMGLRGGQVAAADHRSEVFEPLRDKLLQMPCRTSPSRLPSRGRALKTGPTSNKLPGLC